MPFLPTPLSDLMIFEPKVFQDNRGYFFESYNARTFLDAGLSYSFVQDNESSSSYGVIRGLHYQMNPYAQTKLVRVLHGSILDVAVDIRRNSPTFGRHFSLELTAENKKQLLIPAGFAHGFSVLSERAVVMYKCDQYYNKESEGGIRFDDSDLAIDWKIENGREVISDKDKVLPTFATCLNNF